MRAGGWIWLCTWAKREDVVGVKCVLTHCVCVRVWAERGAFGEMEQEIKREAGGEKKSEMGWGVYTPR